jgi:hypothetical protein
MEEDQALGIGSRRAPPPNEHGIEDRARKFCPILLRIPIRKLNETPTDVFFGTSHFGPYLAAKVIKASIPLVTKRSTDTKDDEGTKQGAPYIPLSDVHLSYKRASSHIDDVKPFSMQSQIRELLALCPRQEEADRYVEAFFQRYNA